MKNYTALPKVCILNDDEVYDAQIWIDIFKEMIVVGLQNTKEVCEYLLQVRAYCRQYHRSFELEIQNVLAQYPNAPDYKTIRNWMRNYEDRGTAGRKPRQTQVNKLLDVESMARGEALQIDDQYIIVVWDAYLKKETTLTLTEETRIVEPDFIFLPEPLPLEPGQVSMLDLFAGAGLAGRGAEDAGAKTVATVENDDDCNRHLAANHPELAERGALIPTEIEDVSYLDIMAKTGIPRGHLGHVHGSPCCQGFSGANTHRHWTDYRNTLTLDMLRLVRDLLPETFTWENVCGTKTYDMDPVTMILMSAMLSLPYRFISFEVRGQNFDCVQDRPRNFILAIREDFGVTPTLPHLSTKKTTIGDVLPHVEALRVGSGAKLREYPATEGAPTFTRDGTAEVKVDGTWRPTTVEEHRILSAVPEDFHFVGDLDDPEVQEEIKERLGNCVMPRVMERIFGDLRAQVDRARAVDLAA